MRKKKLSVFEVTPRLIVRFIFILIVSSLVYKETGIWTTILLSMIYLEIAVKTDWMFALHELQMGMLDAIKDVIEFQNRFFVKSREKGDLKEETNA